MPQRKDPDIPVVTALVITPWPGMDAERIEDRVTRRIEAVVAENKNVETVRSVSRTNVSYVYVELKEGMTETSEIFDDIALRLDQIRELPEGAGPIQFIKDFGSTAALMLTVASPRLEEVQVSLRADQVRAAIEAVLVDAVVVVLEDHVQAEPIVGDGGRGVPAEVVAADEAAGGVEAHGVAARAVVAGVRISDLPDSAMLAHLQGFIQGRLRAAEFHPDAWQPAIVRDPATTRARLLAVAGDKYSYQEMEKYTDELKRTFQTVPQVSKVDRLGVLDEQVTLSFSQERLASYGITLGRLRDVLQARNTALGGGQMQVGDRTVRLEPSGEFRDAREIGGVIVGSSSAGVPLYLRDLVSVDREYQNPPRYLNQYSWADSAGHWHKGRAVTLALQMRPGEKIGEFGHAVDSALAVVSNRLPPDLILARTSDQPLQVEENIHLLMSSLWEAVILVVLVALVGFWEWRSAVLLALSIPLTLALAFGMAATLGIDLQQVSIASLIIALGCWWMCRSWRVTRSSASSTAASRGSSRAGSDPPSCPGQCSTPRSQHRSLSPLLLLTGNVGLFLYSMPVAHLLADRGAGRPKTLSRC
jgi:multidrug efflux pump subunit AcrB